MSRNEINELKLISSVRWRNSARAYAGPLPANGPYTTRNVVIS